LGCGLNVKLELVKSQFNKADNVTRVSKKWLVEDTADMQLCVRKKKDIGKH
jgi:hypothetical protein